MGQHSEFVTFPLVPLHCVVEPENTGVIVLGFSFLYNFFIAYIEADYKGYDERGAFSATSINDGLT